jgi:glycogen debranching enzyme
MPDGPADARLECRLLLDLRHPDEPVPDLATRTAVSGDRLHVGGIDQTPAVRISAHGGEVAYDLVPHDDLLIEMIEERDRGYQHLARAGTAGPILLAPDADGIAGLTLTIEPESDDPEPSPVERWRAELDRRVGLLRRAGPLGDPFAAQLVLAADQFIVAPVAHEGRPADADDAAERTVIAGYHWFTDWGRDTMIGLEGLTLATGRADEAREILRLFARHAREGLIPNLFPEGQREALYHTADSTLWYFHALDRYVARTGDRTLLAELLPLLGDVLEHHRAGTRFGIGVDPSDGLLRQGEGGYQLTWMDAKVDDWVVTPRRGKAVEINALWHNALSLMAEWLADTDPGEAARAREDAERMRASFNRRFWNAQTGLLFDVVDGEDGDDPACRPNQIFAVSLPHPVLDPSRWRAVVDAVGGRLLTPLGLRTLDPDDAAYRPRYFGDLRARDAAYHQGTAWPWLMGAYVDALLRIEPDPDAARRVLAAFDPHLDEAGVGSISEIVDASVPHVPRGCIAQAWSVAEILRAWMKTSHVSTLEQQDPSREASRSGDRSGL